MSQDGYGDREVLLEKLLLALAAGALPTSALKGRREELGLSQHELARMSSVSQSVISRIEAGDRLPTNAQIRKLSTALKTGREDLGLAETLTMMGSLAAKGELPREAVAEFAARLMVIQPDSEAARRLDAAIVGALVDIAEIASRARDGAVIGLKSRVKPRRDGRGIRLDKPHGIPDQRPATNDRHGTGRRRRDAGGRVIQKPYGPANEGAIGA